MAISFLRQVETLRGERTWLTRVSCQRDQERKALAFGTKSKKNQDSQKLENLHYPTMSVTDCSETNHPKCKGFKEPWPVISGGWAVAGESWVKFPNTTSPTGLELGSHG